MVFSSPRLPFLIDRDLHQSDHVFDIAPRSGSLLAAKYFDNVVVDAVGELPVQKLNRQDWMPPPWAQMSPIDTCALS